MFLQILKRVESALKLFHLRRFLLPYLLCQGVQDLILQKKKDEELKKKQQHIYESFLG